MLEKQDIYKNALESEKFTFLELRQQCTGYFFWNNFTLLADQTKLLYILETQWYDN
jgi:hypothetical protein